MKKNQRTLLYLKKPLLGAAAFAGAAALAAGLLLPLTAAEEPGAERIRDAREAAEQAQDVRQIADYLRAVPPDRGPAELEGDVIKVRSARNWHHLTYPTGTLPSNPYGRAQEHVRRFVQDGEAWSGPGIELGARGLGLRSTVNPSENIWTAVGPTPLDSVGTTNNAYTYGTVSGRVGANGLMVDPGNSNVAYAGFVAGGLWKTTNLLAATPTWTPLWDDKDFVTQSVSAITLDPNNSNVIYVGTGDWAASDQFSSGIMKSTDGGATWTQLGADIFTPYSQTLPATGNRWANQNIKTIAIDPKNSNTLLVGTRYDLYLSNDAGASWQICGFGNSYTNPDPNSGPLSAINRISDIVLDSRGAQTVAYVAVGYLTTANNGNNGVYRFTIPASGCPSWPGAFTTLFGGFPTGTGNGTNGASSTGRIELASAIGPDSGLTLYAQVQDAANYDNEGTWVLRPDGGSTTWTKLTGWNTYSGCSSNGTGQDWYDLFLAVDPNNDKSLYIGHIDVYQVTVNASYSSMSQTNMTDVYGTSCANYGKVHPDQHAFTWVGSSGAFLLGNDGGVYYNSNGTAAGFKQINHGINTNQFYAGQIGADFAGDGMGGVQWLFGGMQDNGNASWDSTTSDFTWTARSVGGDGFFTSFDPVAGSETTGWWLTEYTYGSLYASDTGAQGPFAGKSVFTGCEPNYTGSPDWSTPFQLDTLHCKSSSCSNYILGEDYVWASTGYTRGCPSWTRVSPSMVKTSTGSIITVGMAPSEPKAAAVGTDDGKVWWTESAFSGSGCTQTAANSASFSCSTNSGASWIDADPSNAVLPNRVILQVAFDPNNHNSFYAAVGGFDTNTPSTPGHLFQLNRSGSAITVVNKTGNLPDVPASAVAVNPHNRKQVYVGTHFGFYYTDDIDASPVNWVRYQTGLPTTVIAQLTIDRGPAANPTKGTTLAAFTYGRGIYLLKLPVPAGGNNPPVASFTESCTNLACTFTDTSTDDGTLVSWAWTFGDGGSSSSQNPSHTYAAAGTYTVSLTVTDNGSLTGATSHPFTVTSGGGGGITLSTNGYKVQGKQTVDLTWSGASGANVDVYRNGALVFTTANDGFETDNIGAKGSATYVYQVCEAGTSTCSNTSTVVF